MKTLTTRTTLTLLAIASLAACDDPNTPTEPFVDDLPTLEEQIELAVLSDEGAVDMAVALVETTATVATRRGHHRAAEAREYGERARLRFANAREALARGDRRHAIDEGREARRLIARGVEATGGERAVAAMVERIEAMSLTAVENEDAFDDGAAVADELGGIAEAARAELARGNVRAAGERAVFGEQRARSRRPGHNGRPGHVSADRAELAIALGAEAVALAERLLGDDAGEEQLRFLATAHEFLEKARAAFAVGEYARAMHFAELASWSALKAVVLPGGITEEEQREMVDLAESLYAEAVAALGDTPTELEVLMLQRAGRLIELGEQKLAEGHVRGIGAVWQGAVICSWLAS